MGLRVRVVLVILSLLAIAALAVPLALTLADRRTAALAAERDRQLVLAGRCGRNARNSPAAPGRPLLRRVRRRCADRRLRRADPGRTRAQYLRTRCRDGGEPRARRRSGFAVAPHSALGPTHASGRRGCPQRRGAGRSRRGGGRHHCGGARSRYRLVMGGGRLSGPAACWPRWSAVPSRGGCCVRSTGWNAPSPR